VRLRRRYAIGLAVCLAGVVVAIVPAVSSVASGTITITYAGNSSSGPAVLEVDATAATGTTISSITADLLFNGADYYSASLAQVGTTSAWTATIPSSVPAGTYAVSVTATDSSGDPPVTDPSAGTFAFLDQPTLTATADPTTVSYGKQTITFSGQLTATPPGGGPPIDVVAQIFYSSPTDPTLVPLTTTYGDGTYSATVQDAVGGTYTLSTDASAVTAAAQTRVGITVFANPVNLTASAGPAYVAYGKTATLHGQAVYSTGTAYVPLASSPLEIMAGNTALPSVTTDASGDYSTQVPTTDGTRFTVTAGAGDPLLYGSTAVAVLPIRMPLVANWFTAALQPTDTVASSICIRYNASAAAFGAPRLASVGLQYASRPGGPRKSLGLLHAAGAGPGCSGHGLEYLTDLGRSRPLTARLANAYYRVSVDGSRSYEPFTSGVVHSALTMTRISGFSVRPTTITSGQTITVSGVLSQRIGHSWKPYAHRSVGILFFSKSIGLQGSPAAVTGPDGAFRERIQFTGSGTAQMFPLFAGDRSHLQAASPDITFTVRKARHGPGGLRAQVAASQFRTGLKA
jgi:hypothetical protein